MLTVIVLVACTSDASKPLPDTTESADSGVDSDTDIGADTADTADSGEDPDSGGDTGWWECNEDGLLDATTLCADHLLRTCDLPAVGLRRGDWLCWPAHAFCPEAGVYCDDTSEGWAEVPLEFPSDFLAVAEGVLAEPASVFTSPIDDGFVATRTVTATSITEAYNAFYYDEVVAGEEVVLADGTYTDCYIGFEGEGEPGKPLVLRAETPGGVTLDSCAIYMAGSYLVLSGFRFTGEMVYTPVAMGYTGGPCDHCAVREVEIDTVVPAAPTSRPYVQIYGTGNEVSDSSFRGKANTSAVITVDRPDPSQPLSARIYRNHFADRTNTVANDGETNGFEVIRAGYSMDYFYPGYVVIEGNLFERCDGEDEIISLKSGHNTVRFNTFRDNAGQITVRDGFGNVVEGNYILGGNKPNSSGVRVSGANTLVVGNHIQDLAPGGSRWRFPLALATGSDDPYAHYTTTFESVLLYNRVISPDYGFALDTGEDYPPTFYPPYDNLYAANLLYTGGAGTTLGYSFEESLTGNVITDNILDGEFGIDGFTFSAEAATGSGELWRVSGFDGAITGEDARSRLTGPLLELAEQSLVFDGPEIYTQVPLLEAGRVGAP